MSYRWDQLRALLKKASKSERAKLILSVRSIDFIGHFLGNNYRLWNPYDEDQENEEGEIVVNLLTEDENWSEIIEQFPNLTEYRLALHSDFQEGRKLLLDQRARLLYILSDLYSTEAEKDWVFTKGLVEALRIRVQHWGTNFTLATTNFCYSHGSLQLMNGFLIDAWGVRGNAKIYHFDSKERPVNLQVVDFLDYDTIVVDDLTLKYYRDILNALIRIRASSHTQVTTLVFLQGPNIFRNYGKIIELAGSAVDDSKRISKSLTLSQKRTEREVYFPRILYNNTKSDGSLFHQQIEILKGRSVDLFTQAELLMDQLLDRRYDKESDTYANLPNITVFDVPILEDDLDNAKGLFPNVRSFNILNDDGTFTRVEA